MPAFRPLKKQRMGRLAAKAAETTRESSYANI